MTLLTARLLCPLRDQKDWAQMRLSYLSPELYAFGTARPVVSRSYGVS